MFKFSVKFGMFQNSCLIIFNDRKKAADYNSIALKSISNKNVFLRLKLRFSTKFLITGLIKFKKT